MPTDRHEEMNKKLISLLQSIPFAYSDILMEQISCSVLSNEIRQDYYCVFFDVAKKAPQLPLWLDTMPLSWQIPIDEVPLLFQVFTCEGYIAKLEIIDMGFQCIQWARVWDMEPMLDFEYDMQYVHNYLTSDRVLIEKVHTYGCAVDLTLKSKKECVIACFRNCQIRRLHHPTSPIPCLITIKVVSEEDGQYSISSSENIIDFDCSLMYLKLNSIID